MSPRDIREVRIVFDVSGDVPVKSADPEEGGEVVQSAGRRMDVDGIAKLLDMAMTTNDEDVATTAMSVAIQQIHTQFDAGGGSDPGFFEQLVKSWFNRVEKRKEDERRADRERGEGNHGEPPPE
jgi:hypothetical protein